MPKLPLGFNPSVLHRTDDPDTSVQAAHSAKELRARHHEQIMDALRACGPMTSEEMAEVTGLTHAMVWRRMRELCRAKLAKDSGARHRNSSGRKAIVWKARMR